MIFIFKCYSKWLWCRPMKAATSQETVKTLQSIFHDIEELPECIVCNNNNNNNNSKVYYHK